MLYRLVVAVAVASSPTPERSSPPLRPGIVGFPRRCSLRTGSSNAAVLGAVARVAPAGVTVEAYDGLAALPAFNPDVDGGPAGPPSSVAHWRAVLTRADALVVSTPEYAHGLPGALKNALDWVVGSGELVGKPVGVLDASAPSPFAHPQLIEVLTVMSAVVVPGATRLVDIPRRGTDAARLTADPDLAGALRAVVDALWNAWLAGRSGTDAPAT